MFSALPTLAARSLRRLGVVLAVLASLGTLSLVGAHPAAAAIPYDQAVSFESQNYPGRYLRHQNWLGELTPATSALDRADATFIVRRGLTGAPNSVSLESANIRGHYLRHELYRIKLAAPPADRALFNKDATFMPEIVNNEWRFRTVNLPQPHFIRHKYYQLWLDKYDPNNPDLFTRDSTWRRKLAGTISGTTPGIQGRGECTDWALYKRPDMAGTVSGNAQAWTQQASDARRPVSKVPSEGAVMVLRGGVMGAFLETGHVTYVESVQRDAYGNPTSFVVSEQNWNNNRYSTTRTIHVRDLPPNRDGVDFIH